MNLPDHCDYPQKLGGWQGNPGDSLHSSGTKTPEHCLQEICPHLSSTNS